MPTSSHNLLLDLETDPKNKSKNKLLKRLSEVFKKFQEDGGDIQNKLYNCIITDKPNIIEVVQVSGTIGMFDHPHFKFLISNSIKIEYTVGINGDDHAVNVRLIINLLKVESIFKDLGKEIDILIQSNS